MNQKKIFNYKLYLQSLKQMRMIGSISSVLFAVISVLIPLSEVASLKSQIAAGSDIGTGSVVDVLAQNSFLLVSFMVVTPLLTLFAWNYLTKRNSSDFYHSLPYTRFCSYLSTVSAIITWQLIMIVSSAICSIFVYLTNQQYLIVDMSMVFRTYLVMLICNLLCCSAITIACMLTGTLFSNICVSGLIIFFPRFIMMLCMLTLSSNVPFLVQSHIVPVLGRNSNIITSVVFSFFESTDVTDIMLSVSGNIYTFVLACIYFVIGGILFIRRKSEAAGKGAVNKVLQFIFRVMIGFVVCAITITGLISTIREGYSNTSNILLQIVLMVFIAAIIIMIYECISIKSIRGVITSIPSIIVALVIAVVYFGIMNLWVDQSIKYRPTAESLKSVSFSTTTTYYRGKKQDYFESCSSRIKITDEKIKEMLCNALSDNLDKYEKSKEEFRYYEYSDNNIQLEVQFRKGGIPVYRKVSINQKQLTELSSYLNQLDELKSAYLDLPEADAVSITCDANNNAEITTHEIKEIYSMMIQEAKTIGFDKWYQTVHTDNADVVLQGRFMRDGRSYIFAIPLTDALPKTKQAYYRMMNQKAVDSGLKEELADVITSYGNGLKYPVSENVDMIFVDPNSNSTNRLDLLRFTVAHPGDDKEIIHQIGDEIEQLDVNRTIDFTKPYIIVSYESTGDKNLNREKVENYYDYHRQAKYVSFAIQLEGFDHITDYYPVESTDSTYKY